MSKQTSDRELEIITMNIERSEEEGGVGTQPPHQNKLNTEESPKSSLLSKRSWLISLNCVLLTVGGIGGPLLLRLYYVHGGTRNWLSSWLQVVGFPVIVVPIAILYAKDRNRLDFWASPKLLMYSAGLGVLAGLNGFLYSFGSSYLPVSTSQLLLSTQLAFTAAFAFILVKQKFTPYSINAVVVMTMASVLVGLRKDNDTLPNVTKAEYYLGFFLTLGVAAVFGVLFPITERIYIKSKEPITCSKVLQFIFCANFVSTICCTVAMLINKDFEAMPREAREFGLGATKYYVVLASTAVVWMMTTLGSFGLVFCTSSVFAGVFGSALLPLTELAGAIVFHEKFTGEKGVALAFCLWGFASYHYGSYKESNEQKLEPIEGDRKEVIGEKKDPEEEDVTEP